jgi:type I restriction enzyme M protein
MTEARQANNHAGLIWSIADLLRGDYKQSEYGRVILPLVVLRRLDCVLEPTKKQVLDRLAALQGRIANVGPILESITGLPDVYNTSRLTLRTILADPAQVAGNLRAWIAAFDPDTRDVIEKFDFDAQIGRLDRAKLLYLVLSKVTEVDVHPDAVSNIEMGYLYEELVRKFSELSNETAGEHFTPREVIRLMVDLLFIEDDDALRTPGIVRTMLDPACGTGGMLSTAFDYLRELNPGARLEGYGQELNAETYAICRSDMMLKSQKASNIRLGNSFSEDAFKGAHYDYLLANPPFGVEWNGVVAADHALIRADTGSTFEGPHPVDDDVARRDALVVGEVIRAGLSVSHLRAGDDPSVDRNGEEGKILACRSSPPVDLIHEEAQAHALPLRATR